MEISWVIFRVREACLYILVRDAIWPQIRQYFPDNGPDIWFVRRVPFEVREYSSIASRHALAMVVLTTELERDKFSKQIHHVIQEMQNEQVACLRILFRNGVVPVGALVDEFEQYLQIVGEYQRDIPNARMVQLDFSVSLGSFDSKRTQNEYCDKSEALLRSHRQSKTNPKGFVQTYSLMRFDEVLTIHMVFCAERHEQLAVALRSPIQGVCDLVSYR